MKVLYLVSAFCFYAIVEICVQREWRGHKVLCCPKGTAMEVSPGQNVWVTQKTSVCGASSIEEKPDSKSKKVMKWLIALLVLGIVACCCWRKFPIQRITAMITKCCPTKADVVENPKLEVKVIKTEAVAKLPRSQSF